MGATRMPGTASRTAMHGVQRSRVAMVVSNPEVTSSTRHEVAHMVVAVVPCEVVVARGAYGARVAGATRESGG